MVYVRIQINAGNQSAVITAGNVVCGEITKTGKETFTINTMGHIPNIDGISGKSVKNAWDLVKSMKISGSRIIYYQNISNKAHAEDCDII